MYQLRFASTTHSTGVAPDGMKSYEKINRVTTVTLLKGNMVRQQESAGGKTVFEGKEIATAVVIRHFKDPDIPVLGQKLAVEKLAKQDQFGRDQRKAIWETFWNYSPKTESLKHGAYKKEIRKIKQEEEWRNYMDQVKRRIPAFSNEAQI